MAEQCRKKQNKLSKKQINKEKAKERMRKTHSMYITSTKRETIRKSDKIGKFKECIKSGLHHTCVVCNRCLNRRSVSLYKKISTRKL